MTRDEDRRSLLTGCGIRHEGGVTPAQASMRNVRTCRSDVKGEVQAGNTCKDQSTDAEPRVVGMKVL